VLRYDPDASKNGNRKTDEDRQWKTQFKGDLRTLDIIALCKAIEIYGREIGETQHGWVSHSIQCPWEDEHTAGPEWDAKNTSTAILVKDGFIPRFKCLHSHGDNLGEQEFFEWIEAQYPGEVDRYCARCWEPRAERSKVSYSTAKEKGTDQPDGYYRRVLWTAPGVSPVSWVQKLVYPTDSILHPYVQYAQTQTEGADCFILGSILPVVGRCLSRNVYAEFGSTRIYPNLFSLIVGPPGDRKSHTVGISERTALALLPSEAFISDFASSEGLFDEYYTDSGGCPDKISIIDDAAGILATWRTTQYGERVVGLMLRLYDCKGLSEAFRRNKKETTEKNVRRRIPETSTSVVYGATPIDAVFPRQQHQQGLVRRFMHYVAFSMARLISWPQKEVEDEITRLFRPLLDFKGPVGLSAQARPLWDAFQKRNRTKLESVPENRPQERHILATEPTHVLKIATRFEACRQVWNKVECFRGEIREETLQRAIEHVSQCQEAAKVLAGNAKRFETRQQAESILSQIRYRFSADSVYPDTIYVNRSRLTRTFCLHQNRHGALQTDELYIEILPYLIETGDAQLCFKNGKLEIYAFRASDEEPPGTSGPDTQTPPKPSPPASDSDLKQEESQKTDDDSHARGHAHARRSGLYSEQILQNSPIFSTFSPNLGSENLSITDSAPDSYPNKLNPFSPLSPNSPPPLINIDKTSENAVFSNLSQTVAETGSFEAPAQHAETENFSKTAENDLFNDLFLGGGENGDNGEIALTLPREIEKTAVEKIGENRRKCSPNPGFYLLRLSRKRFSTIRKPPPNQESLNRSRYRNLRARS
jgi:hypothetical protein